MRELERRSGVNRWILTLAEQGRLIPTGAEFDAVMAVLREDVPQEAEKATHDAPSA